MPSSVASSKRVASPGKATNPVSLEKERKKRQARQPIARCERCSLVLGQGFICRGVYWLARYTQGTKTTSLTCCAFCCRELAQLYHADLPIETGITRLGIVTVVAPDAAADTTRDGVIAAIARLTMTSRRIAG